MEPTMSNVVALWLLANDQEKQARLTRKDATNMLNSIEPRHIIEEDMIVEYMGKFYHVQLNDDYGIQNVVEYPVFRDEEANDG